MTRRASTLPLAFVVDGLALAVWGLVLVPGVSGGGGADLGVLPPVTSLAVPVAPVISPAPLRAPAGVPTRLLVPALDVDAPVDPVGAPGGDLEVPDDPSRVGWWRSGPTPGDGVGSALVAGHVDSAADGPGALFRLDRLRPGDAVTVVTSAGEAPYRVAAVRHYPKADLPPDLADVGGPPRLVIVSCGGPFDRVHRRYLENVVAYATPA